MKKILVFGATGLLGKPLARELSQKGYQVASVGQANTAEYQCNMLLRSHIKTLVDKLQPDVIINLVAETNVDLCQENPEISAEKNIITQINLVESLLDKNIHLIYCSSDHLYDGFGTQLSTEDQINLKNVYAFSKFTAEVVGKSAKQTVLRTNFFGKSETAGRSSFTDWLYKGLKSNTPLTLFSDVYFNPLSITTTIQCFEKVIENPVEGTFNLGSSSAMSKLAFGVHFAERLGLSKANILVQKMDSLGLIAPRPHNMKMDVSRFAEIFHFELPSLESEINKVASFYERGSA